MSLNQFLIRILITVSSGCSNYSKLTLSFKGADVYNWIDVESNHKKIGHIAKLKFNNEAILAIIRIDNKLKIPVGSQFILHQVLVSDPYIEVVFSNNKTFLTAKDTIIVDIKPM